MVKRVHLELRKYSSCIVKKKQDIIYGSGPLNKYVLACIRYAHDRGFKVIEVIVSTHKGLSDNLTT